MFCTYHHYSRRLETKEMLAYSAEHGIVPEIEVIPIQEINDAWKSLANKQMAKRYVIDMKRSFPVANVS